MSPKTTNVLYWIFFSLFVIFMLMDGIGGLMQEKNGREVMQHLGYPMYALLIFGAAKIIGALALLQPRFPILKEWGYAGFTINFVGAAASRAMSGDPAGLIIAPLVALGFMFFVYWLWKRHLALKSSGTPMHTALRNA